jgi:hypothetical protein
MQHCFPRGELDVLALRHGTDKASTGHDYMRFYEGFLKPFKNEKFVLLELGVGVQDNKGKSLLTWRDYFPRAEIVGVDMREDARDVETDRVKVHIGNCAKPEFLRGLAEIYTPAVIIDDASHRWSHQILAFTTLFKSLDAGGIYVLEDLHTSFGGSRNGNYADHPEDTFAFLSRLAHLVGGDGREHPAVDMGDSGRELRSLARQVDVVAFYRKTAVIVKRAKTENLAQTGARNSEASHTQPRSGAGLVRRVTRRLARLLPWPFRKAAG